MQDNNSETPTGPKLVPSVSPIPVPAHYIPTGFIPGASGPVGKHEYVLQLAKEKTMAELTSYHTKPDPRPSRSAEYATEIRFGQFYYAPSDPRFVPVTDPSVKLEDIPKNGYFSVPDPRPDWSLESDGKKVFNIDDWRGGVADPSEAVGDDNPNPPKPETKSGSDKAKADGPNVLDAIPGVSVEELLKSNNSSNTDVVEPAGPKQFNLYDWSPGTASTSGLVASEGYPLPSRTRQDWWTNLSAWIDELALHYLFVDHNPSDPDPALKPYTTSVPHKRFNSTDPASHVSPCTYYFDLLGRTVVDAALGPIDPTELQKRLIQSTNVIKATLHTMPRYAMSDLQHCVMVRMKPCCKGVKTELDYPARLNATMVLFKNILAARAEVEGWLLDPRVLSVLDDVEAPYLFSSSNVDVHPVDDETKEKRKLGLC